MQQWETQENLADASAELFSDSERWFLLENPEKKNRNSCQDILVRIDGHLMTTDKMSEIGEDGFTIGEFFWGAGDDEEATLHTLEDESYLGPGYPVSLSNTNLTAFGNVYVGEEGTIGKFPVLHVYRFIQLLTGRARLP